MRIQRLASLTVHFCTFLLADASSVFFSRSGGRQAEEQPTWIDVKTQHSGIFKFFPVTTGQILFRVKAGNDARIALTSRQVEENPMYEILIGTRGNKNTVIRKNRSKPETMTNTPNILNKSGYRGFWIRWQDGAISIGKRHQPKPFLTFLELHDVKPATIGYYGISTAYGTTGMWEFLDEGGCATKTPDDVNYKFYPITVGSLIVEVKSKSNAHIALSSNKGLLAPVYMIFLGYENNTKSVFVHRRFVDSPWINQVVVDTPDLLDENEYRKFVITWVNGHIKVYAENQTDASLLEWRDPNPFSINHIGVRTLWDGARGSWRFRFDLPPETPVRRQTNIMKPASNALLMRASRKPQRPDTIEGHKTFFAGEARRQDTILPYKANPDHSSCCDDPNHKTGDCSGDGPPSSDLRTIYRPPMHEHRQQFGEATPKRAVDTFQRRRHGNYRP